MPTLNLLFTLLLLHMEFPPNETFLPVRVTDRQDVRLLELTEIGAFGVWRKDRPGIPAHFHTGIDVKRPSNDYQEEPIFPVASGVVISIRRDGPYAQVIIEHMNQGQFYWTVYEHIAGIQVSLHDEVSPHRPIARFFNRQELDTYGWQFDHFHLEVLRQEPFLLSPTEAHPDRHFAAYSLNCTTEQLLEEKYINPIRFLSQ